jgi:hypothetical protein
MRSLKHRITNIFSNSTVVDHRQFVIQAFEKKRDYTQPVIQRRVLIKYLGLSFSGFGILSACSVKDSDNASMIGISRQDQFQLLWKVVFPAEELGLGRYAEESLSRILRLQGEKAKSVIGFYQLFTRRLWINSWFGLKAQDSISAGEAAVADILQSDDDDDANKALDIIYHELRKVKGLYHNMWGRPFSEYDKKCHYWESYDQPVV